PPRSTLLPCPTRFRSPYSLRVSDEMRIYEKLLANSSLSQAPCAPDTLRMMAQFSVLSRLKEPENSSIYSKMRVYDGENLKDTDPDRKSTRLNSSHVKI